MRWAFGFLFVIACAGERAEPVSAPAPSASAAGANAPASDEPTSRPALHTDLVATVAREYKSWRLVDDETHWAPGLCRLPANGGQHISRADKAAHDGKLFMLWALDLEAYGMAVGWIDQPFRTTNAQMPSGALPTDVVQVLVKESFVAEPYSPGDPTKFGIHPAVRDGKTFRPGDPIGLFVMVQFAKAREGTDDGWIYGTVAPDGTVTSASDVGGCRDCHAARENRLFGLPRPAALGM